MRIQDLQAVLEGLHFRVVPGYDEIAVECNWCSTGNYQFYDDTAYPEIWVRAAAEHFMAYHADKMPTIKGVRNVLAPFIPPSTPEEIEKFLAS